MPIADFPPSTFQIGYNRSKEILSGNDSNTSLQSGKVPDNTEDTNHTPVSKHCGRIWLYHYTWILHATPQK